MELFRTTEHLGLKTALPQPPGNSAKALQNFVRHPHNGWLEQADGYGPKFTLPTTDASKNVYDVSIVDIHNFFVKEHGGKQVTVCVGTYRKAYRATSASTAASSGSIVGTVFTDTTHGSGSFAVGDLLFGTGVTPGTYIVSLGTGTGSNNGGTYNVSVLHEVSVVSETITSKKSIARTGIWVSHSWSGSAWVEAWVELTEIEIFPFHAWGSGATELQFESDTHSIYATNYFQNWIAIFENYLTSNDNDNYLLVLTSDTGTYDYVTLFGDATIKTLRATPTNIILSRNWMNGEMPSSITSHIFTLFNEIRLTTGNGADSVAGATPTAVNTMAGYRDKDFGWATSDATMDKLFSERACLAVWRYAFGASELFSASSNKPLLKGDYKVKYTLGLDDGNETELRNPKELLVKQAVAVDLAVDSTYTLPTFDLSKNASRICSDGTNFYIASIKQTPNVPEVIKINMVTGVEDSRYTAVNESIPVVGIGDMIYDDGSIYFLLFVSVLVLVKIDAATMTLVKTVEIDAAAATKNVTRLLALGGFIYVANQDAAAGVNSRMTKVDASAMTIAYTAVLTSDSTLITSMIAFGSDILLGYASAPTLIKRMRVTDFLFTDSWTIAAAGSGYVGDLYLQDSNTLVIGCMTSPAKIIKLDLTTDAETVSAFSGNLVTSFASDGTHLYLVYGGVTPMIGNRFNVSTMAMIGTDFAIPSLATETVNLLYVNGYIYVLVTHTSATIASYVTRINTDVNSNVSTNGSEEIRFKPIISAGTILKRGDKLRAYVSDDNGVNYYFTKEVNLLATFGDALGIAWDAAAYYDSVLKHFYHRGEVIIINADDWDAKGAIASTVLGRDPGDSGSVNYLHGTVVGNRSYASNVLIGSPAVNEPNKVVVCANGAGVIMNDVFPNDVANVIDLEYSDGDQIVCGVPLADRILVLKKRSIILVTNNGGDYERDQIAVGIGCCSANTARAFEDVDYFCDYNGVYSYSTGELRLLNADWLLDWKALSVATKEAAIGIIDTINRKYVVSVGGVQYAYDIRSDGQIGEWVKYSWAHAPIQLALNTPDATNPGSIDFLTADKIENVSKATLQDSTNFTMTWESNEINPLISKSGYDFDTLIQHLIFEYQSSVPITATLYLDGSGSATATYVLAAANTKALVLAPLSAKCKTYRIKYSATTTGAGQTVKIKARIDYFEVIPSGGDTVVY